LCVLEIALKSLVAGCKKLTGENISEYFVLCTYPYWLSHSFLLNASCFYTFSRINGALRDLSSAIAYIFFESKAKL